MGDIRAARQALIDRILTGEGRATRDARRAAYDNEGGAEPVRALLDKVARNAYKVVDEDVAAAKAAGISEDELFELVVCAAIGQSSRQYDNAMAALATALKEG